MRLLLACATSAACLGAAPLGSPGALAQRAFCEPTFVADGTPRRSGSGFLLYGRKYPRRTYLFTAQHLFSLPAEEMPRRVTSAVCASPETGRAYPTAAALSVTGAHPMGPLDSLKDVAVFPVRGRSPGLSLAEQDVSPGEVVWLLARVRSGSETSMLLHRAVAGASSGYLVYKFDDQTIGLDQTSGSAILNSAGEVVGLNVGYGRATGGQLVGVANRWSTLKAVVDELP